MSKLNTYTMENKSVVASEFNSYVTKVVAEMLLDNNVEASMTKSLFGTRLDSLRLRGSIEVEIPMVDVSDEEFTASIKAYSTKQRKLLWEYKRLSLRVALLGTLLDREVNKKKFNYRLTNLVESIVKTVLEQGKDSVTLAQIVHRAVKFVGTKKVVTKDGSYVSSDAWSNDQLVLQFVSELAELDYVNLTVTGKVHTVSLTENTEKYITKEDAEYYSSVAQFVGMKTILTEPTNVVTMSRSSWFYDMPELSDAHEEFNSIMLNIQYSFKADAEDRVEAAYKAHVGYDSMSTKQKAWVIPRVAMLRAQIQASNEKGGHYVGGLQDSALRHYYGAEVGHFQTSKELRSLVTVANIVNPVKYDFRNNVVQMYAVLSGIKELGLYVGLTADSQQLGDLRTLLAERMNEELGIESFNKGNIKPLFMIWAYNAGKKRLLSGVVKEEVSFFTGGITETITTPGLRVISGLEGKDDQLWSAFEGTLVELVPGIVAIKALFRKLTKANPVIESEWTLPDGSKAQYASAKTIKQELTWVSSTGTKHTHTHYRKEIVDGEKNTGLLPRVIHSFDAYVMRQLVIRAHKLGIIVVPNHDSFIFDECHKETIDMLVSEIFTELLESKALENVVNELNLSNADLTVKDENNDVVVSSMFGARLTPADIYAGTPMSPEEM